MPPVIIASRDRAVPRNRAFTSQESHMSAMQSLFTLLANTPTPNFPDGLSMWHWIIAGLIILSPLLLIELLGMRYIPNNRVGVIEKLWSSKGSVSGGRIIALNDEAGFQADVLRGGFHFGYWRWQYRIHKV